MFLVCPKCLAARPEAILSLGFRCEACGHRWEAPHASLAKAYYADLAELDVDLVTDDGDRFRVSEFPVVIGRDSDFRALQSNLAVSRRHCSVDFDNVAGTFVVHDLGGKTGTTVSGRLLAAGQHTPVQPGDEIRLAGVRVRLDAHVKAEIPEDRTGPTGPGEREIDLSACSPQGYLGFGEDGVVTARSQMSAIASVMALLVASGDRTGWRLLVLQRDAIRVMGKSWSNGS